MTELTMVLGGSRSGKSRHALKLAQRYGSDILFIATGEARDEEMVRRIQEHRQARPASWRTIEEPLALVDVLPSAKADALLIDCLTLWVSNQLLRLWTEDGGPHAYAAIRRAVENATGDLLDCLTQLKTPVIIVSDEVGHSIVPDNPMGRLFRDLLGWANQQLASQAERVFYLVAGIPLEIKKPGDQ